jgi:hypothetical protein
MIAEATSSAPTGWLFALFPFFFVGMWCFVSLVLSHTGGWHRLAEKFRAFRPAAGRRYWMQSARMGLVNYNSILTIHVSDEGLHLAVWWMFRLSHPALMIPWSEIRNVVVKKFLWMSWVEADIGEERLVKISLPRKVLEGYESRVRLDA